MDMIILNVVKSKHIKGLMSHGKEAKPLHFLCILLSSFNVTHNWENKYVK